MRNTTILCILLVIITLGIFAQTAGHQFINFDDTLYVTDNPAVKDGLKPATIAWAFKATAASNWHPLTWLSHMLDVQLFGLRPALHHLMSVILHALSAFLLYRLLLRITAAPWASLFTAALFALHPLHVESVAWVAERKDVLSGIFWTLTLLCYARYVEKPGAGRYLTALACFGLGLMSKPMLVTLPVVLLILDYWPLNRLSPAESDTPSRTFSSLIIEKIPFFLLAAASSLITVMTQHKGGAMANLEKAPLGLRLGNAVIAYVRYLIDTVWPSDLAILYPFPTSLSLASLVGAALLLIAISWGVFGPGRRHRWLAAGWLWYLVTLLPVIGLIQVGGQSHADRYTYIPLTGIFIIIAWGVPQLLERWNYRKEALMIAGGLTLCVLATLSWRQIAYWKDSITLFRHTLEVTSGNYLILNNYGIALDQAGDFDGAMKYYQEALNVWPRSAHAHNNLGAVLARKGRYAEAMEHYRSALAIKPDYIMAQVNIGKALAGMGDTEAAIRTYQQVLERDPTFSEVHLNLTQLYLKLNDNDRAMQHYQELRRLDPRSPKGALTIAVDLAQAGRMEEAARFFNEAVQIAPYSLEAQFNFGVFLAKQGRTAEAREHFIQALRIKPDSPQVQQWLQRLGQP